MVAFAQSILGVISGIAANLYNWGIFLFVWLLLAVVTLLWEPIIGVILLILAPLIAVVLIYIILCINETLFFIYVGREIWNGMVPILGLMVVLNIRLLFSFFGAAADILTRADFITLFYAIYQCLWFFVDMAFDIVLVIVSVAPVMLTAMSQIIAFVVLQVFDASMYLFEWCVWVFGDLWTQLEPTLFALMALLNEFGDLIGRRRGTDSVKYSTLSSVSGRYFDTLYAHSRGRDYDRQLRDLGVIGQRASMVHHTQISFEPVHVESMHNFGRRSDANDTQHTLGPRSGSRWHTKPPHARVGGGRHGYHPRTGRHFHTRFFEPGTPLNFDHTDVHGAFMNHTARMHKHDRKQQTRSSPHETDQYVEALLRRRALGTNMIYHAREAVHSAVDFMPSIEHHVDMLSRSGTNLCKNVFGFDTCTEAVKHYNTKYTNPDDFLYDVLPDWSQHPLTRDTLAAQRERGEHLDADGRHRMSFHEWKRAQTPVFGFHGADEYNRYLNDKASASSRNFNLNEAATGEIEDTAMPAPGNLPLTSVADCYTTNPRNILCFPPIPPRGWYMPYIVVSIPVDLDRDCEGFKKPPNPRDDSLFDLTRLLNPIDIVYNSFVWMQYVLGLSITVLFVFEVNALKYPFLRWFVDGLLRYHDPRDTPPNTKILLCLLAYLYYPVALAFYIYTASIILPPLWNWLIQTWQLILTPFQVYAAQQGKLYEWYSQSDPKHGFYRFAPSRVVADKYVIQPAALAPVPVGVTPGALTKTGSVQLSGGGSASTYTSGMPRIQGSIDAAGLSIDDHNTPNASPKMLLEAALDASQRIAAGADMNSADGADIERTSTNQAFVRAVEDLKERIKQSEALYTVMVEPSVSAATTKLHDLKVELQQYANALHQHHGILDESIATRHEAHKHRHPVFRQRHPVHSYMMTISYMDQLFHNMMLRRNHKKGARLEDAHFLPHPQAV